jgi:hypothetical protein
MATTVDYTSPTDGDIVKNVENNEIYIMGSSTGSFDMDSAFALNRESYFHYNVLEALEDGT